jgi:hypothetical protein
MNQCGELQKWLKWYRYRISLRSKVDDYTDKAFVELVRELAVNLDNWRERTISNLYWVQQTHFA